MSAAVPLTGGPEGNHPSGVRVDRPEALAEMVALGLPAEVAEVATTFRCADCGGRPTAVVLETDAGVDDEWRVIVEHAASCPYLRAGLAAQAAVN